MEAARYKVSHWLLAMVILLGELACFERRKAFELSDVGDSRTTADPLPSSALGFLFECLQKDDTQWQLAEETRMKQVHGKWVGPMAANYLLTKYANPPLWGCSSLTRSSG